MKRGFLALPSLLVALTAAQAQADSTGAQAIDAIVAQDASGSYVQVAQAVTTEDWIEALKTPVDPAELQVRDRITRGLRVEADAPPPASGVPFKVQFAFGSAELTDDARAVLNELGTALVSNQLSPYRFRITGHTDAVGEKEFNLSLSEQRAQAVRNYLTGNFNISQARLDSVGLGETMLLEPSNPSADANRRVEIMNVGADG